MLLVEDDPGPGMAVRDQILAEGHGVDRVTRSPTRAAAPRAWPTTWCSST